MFFRKKKETDVDVLQKIKARIAEDDKKTNTNTTPVETTENFDDDILTDTSDVINDHDNDEQDDVINDINHVVEQSIVANDDEKDSFESSLESDFLADVFADDGKSTNEANRTNATAYSDTKDSASDDVIENDTDNESKKLGLDGKYYSDDDLAYMSADRLRELGFLDNNETNSTASKAQDVVLDEDDEDSEDVDNMNDIDDDVDGLDDDIELDNFTTTDKTNNTTKNLDSDEDLIDVDNKKADQEYLDDVFDDDDASEYLDDDNDNNDNVNSIEDRIDGGVNDVVLDDQFAGDLRDNRSDNATLNTSDSRRAIVSQPTHQMTNMQSRVKNAAGGNAYYENDAHNQNHVINKQNVSDVSFPAVPNDNSVTNVLADNLTSSLSAADNKHVVSSQTKANVKGSITDLIENVKNQILSKRQERANDYRGAKGKTIEQFVEELIRPKLVEYLDANLDRLVKEAVEKEIQKIVAEVDTEDI